jgi:hypothetical protein
VTDNQKIFDLCEEVRVELVRALRLHSQFNSAHEGYAVILEELDELKAECWKKRADRDRGAMRLEAVQIAAMALRFALEICDP